MVNIMRNQVETWLENKALLKLNVFNYKGHESLLHGRILDYNPDRNNILFYDDDYKQVANILLNEIIDVEFS